MRLHGHQFARRTGARRLVALLLAATALGCATGATAPAPTGTGTVTGTLRLVPREGVTPGKAGASAYADRRLRDVTFVDYSKPGFAVAYVNAGTRPGGTAELVIHATGVRTRMDPSYAAVGLGGALVVRNDSAGAHVLSAPALGLVRRIEPGERAEVVLSIAGEQSLFLLDVPRSESTVFVAPGPWTVVGPDGRFELRGITPGRHELLAWHPRFPPAHAFVDVAADGIVQSDLAMGVDQTGGAAEDAPADRP